MSSSTRTQKLTPDYLQLDLLLRTYSVSFIFSQNIYLFAINGKRYTIVIIATRILCNITHESTNRK